MYGIDHTGFYPNNNDVISKSVCLKLNSSILEYTYRAVSSTHLINCFTNSLTSFPRTFLNFLLAFDSSVFTFSLFSLNASSKNTWAYNDEDFLESRIQCFDESMPLLRETTIYRNQNYIGILKIT